MTQTLYRARWVDDHLEIESAEFKKTAKTWTATTSPGLAFGCRVRFNSQPGAISAAQAAKDFLDQQERVVKYHCDIANVLQARIEAASKDWTR